MLLQLQLFCSFVVLRVYFHYMNAVDIDILRATIIYLRLVRLDDQLSPYLPQDNKTLISGKYLVS